MQASFSEICTRNYRHATKNPELEASGVPGVRDGSETPPQNRKNCCRKDILFQNALFLAKTFPKIDKH